MAGYLVVGGAGFIGSNFCELLQERGVKISVMDALTYAGTEENLSHVEHDFYQGDISDRERVREVMREVEPEYVLNFAAETHVDRSIREPGPFVQANIVGATHLLEQAREQSVSRYLQVSTDEVYGDLGDTQGTYFEEETPLAPNCPYAATKAAADLMVLSAHETYDQNVVITRCTNNYGPRQYPEKLIPFFLFRALGDETVPLYGDGMNVRDWLYVQDHCRAIWEVLHRGRAGEVYNIGGHNEKTNLEITEILLKALGKPMELVEFVTDRKAHDRRYAMNPEKLRSELGWEPEHPFEHWITETIEWYLRHPQWIEHVAQKSADFRRELYG